MTNIKQQPIAPLQSSIVMKTITVSPNNRRIAYCFDNQKTVIVDTNTFRSYDETGRITFSPTSQQYAFLAISSNRWKVVVDGQEQKEYEYVLDGPAFSAVGQRLAYSAKINDKSWAVIDNGKELKPYENLIKGSLSFSPDGQHLAYGAVVNGKYFVVIDEQEHKQYANCCGDYKSPIFSPDSQHMVYFASNEDEKQFMVLDGVEGKRYDIALACCFSPDSKQLAYWAVEGNNWYVIVNEGKYGPHESGAMIVFSPDSKQMPYAFVEKGKIYVNVGEKIDGPYDLIRKINFSPDSKRMAYVVAENEKWFAIIDGEKHGPFADVGPIVFSPDSKRVAYWAKLRSDVGDDYSVVVDGQSQNKYRKMDYISFSPDSKRVVYYAMELPTTQNGGRGHQLMIDGEVGAQHHGLFACRSIVFDSPTNLYYLANNDGTICSVEMDLGTDHNDLNDSKCQFCGKQVHEGKGIVVMNQGNAVEVAQQMLSRKCVCSNCSSVFCLECGNAEGYKKGTGNTHCPNCGKQVALEQLL